MAVAVAVGSGCGARATADALDGAVAAVELAGAEAARAQRESAVVAAFAGARAAVDDALERSDPSSVEMRRAAFLEAAARGDLGTAALLSWTWEPSPSDPDGFAAWISVLAATGRQALAADLAWQAAREFPEERPRWIRLWYGALAADASRFPPLAAGVEGNAILSELDPFTGQSSIILKMVHDGEPFAVFKPHQVLRHQSFRGEIASFRLCHLIRCSFQVPVNREAWIPEADFRELVGADPDDDLRFGTSRRLIFFDEPSGPALYGVVKAWVPDFTRFPLEYTRVWHPLVSAGVTREELEAMTVAEAIAPFDGQPRGFYRQIVERAQGMTAYDLARQLSDLHVFDLLINNFDRYQPVWFGMNVHWQQGGFVSIDNGASFSLPSEFGWRAARDRLRHIEVFSRDVIDAVRWMDPEAAFPLLFPPNPHMVDERERFDAFLERRQWLLEYVDALVAEHGEDAVYLFE